MQEIQDLLSVFQTISPNWEQGEYASVLEDAFKTITDKIWSGSLHDEDANKPNVADDELTNDASADAVDRNLREAQHLIDAFRLSQKAKMVESISKMTEDLLQGTSLADFCEKNGVGKAPDSDFNSLFNTEPDAALKMLQTYSQYAEKLKLFAKKVHAVQAESQAIDTHAEVNVEETIPYYFEGVEFDTEQLSTLCAKLIEKKWLDKNTKIDDFIYFFSGQGKEPVKRLRWMDSTVFLATFLMLSTRDRSLWKKASHIFLAPSRKDGKHYPINATNIRNVYSSAKIADIYPENQAKVKAILYSVKKEI